MDRTNPSARHRIYLLSVWREDNGEPGQAILRFRLEDPRSGQRQGFVTWAALVAALEQEINKNDGGRLEEGS